ncbi:MAG: FdhF/YdeP family oxidoreductase [Planctomycetota bacterium]|nr:FdhF/YdeP family oxidoreductase [Planctomycetota bacterium]
MARQRRGFTDLAYDWMPFGLGHAKPHHYLEMLKIVWRNRDNLGHAWRVLNRGVCDGCALGTSGLKDWTIDGTHLCLVRLNLLRLNTMPALDPERLRDLGALRDLDSRQLRELGRLPFPMRRRRGEPGFTRIGWEELWREAGARWRAFKPERTYLYVTSRGVTNEVYYVAQKTMRYLGSNNVDNSARLCHSPSTAGLKSTVGVAATTCSYKDWYDADLIVFFGSNPANDQPVAIKYLLEARKRGARVLMVNAYREPGLERYWVPSNPGSALFGTKLCDGVALVKVGGDLAFLNAVSKLVIESGAYNRDFVAQACEGFEAYAAALAEQPMEDLLARAGVKLETVQAFAKEVADAETGVFVWSMGITQHAHGSDTVRAIANLGLLREFVGRVGCGLMPIRGHSGVQGGAEMGAYSTAFPGGKPIDAEQAKHFGELWGFEVPAEKGLTTVEMLEAARGGGIDALYCIGGNFLETMPEPGRIEAGLAKMPLRLHSDIVLTKQMFVEPAEAVYLLPARTRYEQRGGGTETTTERRVIFSPEIPGHEIGEARSEWELLLDFAKAVKPEGYAKVHFEDGAQIRAEIERAVPFYKGIAGLAQQGDQFQWGGPRLCVDRRFPTPDGKAHFVPVAPPPSRPAAGAFLLATRRGKQFNSMIQADTDALTGAARDHIFIARADAKRLGLRQDDAIVVRNALGQYRGRAFLAEVAPGTLQGHWPEVNGLIPHGRVDAGGGVPDYNAEVTLERA